jgi:hypothetical protein
MDLGSFFLHRILEELDGPLNNRFFFWVCLVIFVPRGLGAIEMNFDLLWI